MIIPLYRHQILRDRTTNDRDRRASLSNDWFMQKLIHDVGLYYPIPVHCGAPKMQEW